MQHLLTISLACVAVSGSSLKPHPDALPNSHKPGEVDIEANLRFVIADPTTLPGIVLDETDAVLKGSWHYSTHTPPYVGIGYLHDRKEGKGEKSVTWTPDIPVTGEYEIRISHCYNVRRATNTPITIRHARGETVVRINQQDVPGHGRLFRTIGVFQFVKGVSGSVMISTGGTDGKYVIADAVQFLPAKEPGAPGPKSPPSSPSAPTPEEAHGNNRETIAKKVSLDPIAPVSSVPR